MHPANRQQTFKAPPTSESISQQARREKALEEQRHKRSHQVDSLRNLDAFSSLTLDGTNDDNEDDADEDEDDDPTIVREGIGHLTSLLSPTSATSGRAPSRGRGRIISDSSSKKPRKPNARFANKIMYAELLEMKDDGQLLADGGRMNDSNADDDGIPLDLHTDWVALGPVPKGKRCLAVSNQSSNIPGRVSNALLRSRLMGRTILSFPSPLPPLTILDCILDDNWRTNGILHVLDVILWKGQNIGECEANFRFWWRNTRIDELAFLDPVSPTKPKADPASASASTSTTAAATTTGQPSRLQIFAYPVTFLPVPYHLDLSYRSLLSTIIPSSRSTRQATVKLPPRLTGTNINNTDMEIDQQPPSSSSSSHVAEIESDGLLLYVSQASYECGTSPLSTWIPVVSYTPGKPSPLSVFEKLVTRRMQTSMNH